MALLERRKSKEWTLDDLDDLLERVEALEDAVEELQEREKAPASSEVVSEEDRLLKSWLVSVLAKSAAPGAAVSAPASPGPASADKVGE